jgi:hypothetical protein
MAQFCATGIGGLGGQDVIAATLSRREAVSNVIIDESVGTVRDQLDVEN